MKITSNYIKQIIKEELQKEAGILSKIRRGIFGSTAEDRAMDKVEKKFEQINKLLSGTKKIDLESAKEVHRKLILDDYGKGTEFWDILKNLSGERKKNVSREIKDRLKEFIQKAIQHNAKVTKEKQTADEKAREEQHKKSYEDWREKEKARNLKSTADYEREKYEKKRDAEYSGYAKKQSDDFNAERERQRPPRRLTGTHNGVDQYSDGSSVVWGDQATARYGAPPGHDREMIDYDELKRLSENKEKNYMKMLIESLKNNNIKEGKFNTEGRLGKRAITSRDYIIGMLDPSSESYKKMKHAPDGRGMVSTSFGYFTYLPLEKHEYNKYETFIMHGIKDYEKYFSPSRVQSKTERYGFLSGDAKEIGSPCEYLNYLMIDKGPDAQIHLDLDDIKDENSFDQLGFIKC